MQRWPLNCKAASVLCGIALFAAWSKAGGEVSGHSGNESTDASRQTGRLRQGMVSSDAWERERSYRSLYEEALFCTNRKVSSVYLAALLEGIEDESDVVRQSVAASLSVFARSLFPASLLQQAETVLGSRQELGRGEMLLWGALGLRCHTAKVERHVEQWVQMQHAWEDGQLELSSITQNSIEWRAVLALARHGDGGAVALVVELAENENLSNADRVWMVYDLAYIRRPEAVELLRKYANCDDSTGAPEHGGAMADYAAPLWIYAAWGLARSLEDFPVAGSEPDDFAPEKDRIRKFLTGHTGPWKIKGQNDPPVAHVMPAAIARATTVTPGQAAPTTSGVDTNALKSGLPRNASAPASSQHGSRRSALTAGACGIAALGGMAILIWRRRAARLARRKG